MHGGFDFDTDEVHASVPEMSKDDVKLPSDADGAVAMNDAATPRRRAANFRGRHQQKSMREGYAEEHQPKRSKRERVRQWGKEMIKVLCQSNVYYICFIQLHYYSIW